jgi:hypothetical protein
VHAPPVQAAVAFGRLHALPQAPQFTGSVCVSKPSSAVPSQSSSISLDLGAGRARHRGAGRSPPRRAHDGPGRRAGADAGRARVPEPEVLVDLAVAVVVDAVADLGGRLAAVAIPAARRACREGEQGGAECEASDSTESEFHVHLERKGRYACTGRWGGVHGPEGSGAPALDPGPPLPDAPGHGGVPWPSPTRSPRRSSV